MYVCIQKYTHLHSFADKHLGSFYILAIANNATINIGVHIYNGILLFHKKSIILPYAITWIQLENIMLSEISQRKTNIV